MSFRPSLFASSATGFLANIIEGQPGLVTCSVGPTHYSSIYWPAYARSCVAAYEIDVRLSDSIVVRRFNYESVAPPPPTCSSNLSGSFLISQLLR